MPQKLLLIDDDEGITEALADVLQDAGYLVETACNGAEGLVRLGPDHDIDLVLLDLTMPVMDGFEFRRRTLRDDRLRHLPVIVVTAGLMSDALDVLQAAACLSKTTPVASILAIVASVLDTASSRP